MRRLKSNSPCVVKNLLGVWRCILLTLWICGFGYEVRGAPSDSTLATARCHARCLSREFAVNSTVPMCTTSQCQKCMLPCSKPRQTSDECHQMCVKMFNQSRECEASCHFILVVVKNFTSLEKGDGSVTPPAGAPSVTYKNFTTMVVSWQPALNATGIPVYLLQMALSGDTTQTAFILNKLFTSPTAELHEATLCGWLDTPPARSSFDGISYSFLVATVTENGTVSYSIKSNKTSLPKPQPVSNITIESYVWDPSKVGYDNLFMVSSWLPPQGQKHLITSYGIRWEPSWDCYNSLTPRFNQTSSAKPTGITYMYPEQKKKNCRHNLWIYSMIGCSLSVGQMFSQAYPGCLNVTGFPIKNCYTYDPPDPKPGEDVVRNPEAGPLITADDYTFSVNLTWKPPVYLYKPLKFYILHLTKSGEIVTTYSPSTFHLWSRIKPNVTCTWRVQALYNRLGQSSEEQRFTTPGVDPEKLRVNLMFEFVPVAKEGKFYLNASWTKPLFNYSRIDFYDVIYQTGEEQQIQKRTNQTYFVVPNLLHGQPVKFQVTPKYAHDWIVGSVTAKTLKAPSPDEGSVSVRNIRDGPPIQNKHNKTYSFDFTWEAPLFAYSDATYRVKYELSGYTPATRKIKVNKAAVTISSVRPAEELNVLVSPIFENQFVKGKEKSFKVTAPQPSPADVKVQHALHGELKLDVDDLLYTVIHWSEPLFNYSAVKHYSLRYGPKSAFGSPTRRDIAQLDEVKQTNRSFRFNNITMDSIFEVTPVFEALMVRGEAVKLDINIPRAKADTENTKVMSLSDIAGLSIGVLIFVVVLITAAGILLHQRRKQSKLRAKGHVGKNGIVIDEWEVASDQITLEEELGEGAFGKVFKGVLTELLKSSKTLSIVPSKQRDISPQKKAKYTVAIKMLHDMADNEQRREFLEEIQLMKAVGCHKNIVNMIGCCTVNEPMFLVVEFVPYGDLLHYLRKRRGKLKEYLGDESEGRYRSTYWEAYVKQHKPGQISIKADEMERIYVNSPQSVKNGGADIELISFRANKSVEEAEGNANLGVTMSDEDFSEESLSSGDLMAFAWQVAEGMEYLEKKGFVHRDLAARNVLVGDKKIAKVADFGLTRHVYEEKVYHAKRNRKLPIKWMSIEAIFDQVFTSKSDVWAYGVLLWELVTLGGTPYPTINNRELLRLLKSGYRMEKPDTCSDELYELMQMCWQESPNNRPNFCQLRQKLEEMLMVDNPYLDLSVVDESQAYYNVPSFNSANEEFSSVSVDNENQALLAGGDDTIPNAINQQPWSEGKQVPTERSLDDSKDPFDTQTNTQEVNDINNIKLDIDELEQRLYRSKARSLVL